MCARVDAEIIEPERGDEGAVRPHRVLQAASSRSAFRLVAHWVQVLAGVCERVRLVASVEAGIFLTRARAAAVATSSYPLEAAGERISMVCMCMRVPVARVRDQSRAHCHVHPGSVEKLRYAERCRARV